MRYVTQGSDVVLDVNYGSVKWVMVHLMVI